jgi:YesN/AraC family two-component response regulator
MGKYPITFWCAPIPQFTNEERYKEIVDAGFTLVCPPLDADSYNGCGLGKEENLKILDLCQKYGLKAIIMDKRIKLVLHYMSNHYNEQLTVQKMAALVNLSDMYFGNLFKQVTGMTFRKFLTLIRMNRAEDMLYSGEYKVNEIADACGFSDVFYFSRQFKENRGFAPSKAMSSNRIT